mmetsp:Transcript_8682/g.17777  ORF Transcript_8682/g.17777 Transcript_8682/m.17777 type:complete len:246 (-) Transcript_8682:724-1461(-)
MGHQRVERHRNRPLRHLRLHPLEKRAGPRHPPPPEMRHRRRRRVTAPQPPRDGLFPCLPDAPAGDGVRRPTRRDGDALHRVDEGARPGDRGQLRVLGRRRGGGATVRGPLLSRRIRTREAAGDTGRRGAARNVEEQKKRVSAGAVRGGVSDAAVGGAGVVAASGRSVAVGGDAGRVRAGADWEPRIASLRVRRGARCLHPGAQRSGEVDHPGVRGKKSFDGAAPPRGGYPGTGASGASERHGTEC